MRMTPITNNENIKTFTHLKIPKHLEIPQEIPEDRQIRRRRNILKLFFFFSLGIHPTTDQLLTLSFIPLGILGFKYFKGGRSQTN